jgi:hypothetical protein
MCVSPRLVIWHTASSDRSVDPFNGFERLDFYVVREQRLSELTTGEKKPRPL